MKDLDKVLHGIMSEEAIGELMLAKTALEEKYELINEKDRTIKELLQKSRNIEERLKEVEELLSEAELQNQKSENLAFERGVEAVIKDLLSIITQYERINNQLSDDAEEIEPLNRILRSLETRYGLERIDGQPEKIDPEIHRVIDVIHDDVDKEQIILLSSGYRLNGKVLLPVKLRVITGGKGNNSCITAHSNSTKGKLRLLESGCSESETPEGAA